ncbi:MAG: TetR/AcrR family transcriptional regulator [Cellvibrionaceae bacterium]
MAGGRQREFDREDVLEKAMYVFWKKGYVGASLSDLTSAMGINKPSMYATFGNKEQLFIQATEYYIEHYAKPQVRFLLEEGKSLQERVSAYLKSTLLAQCDGSGPKGCYISLCVSESASESLPKAAFSMIESARDFGSAYLQQFFTDEITKERLSKNLKPAEMALFIITVLHGTAALARGGKAFEELEPMIDNVLAALNLGADAKAT